MKSVPTLFRFADLKARNIANNWSSLRRLIDHEGFPTGFLISPRIRVWREDELIRWINSRPTYVEPILIGGAKRLAEGIPIRPKRKRCA